MNRGFVTALLVVSTLATVTDGSALVWPDVANRVERDLSAADPLTRRAAARDLPGMGAARGGPLAVAALGDPDDEVRLAAASAAIRLRALGATDAVAGWLNAPDPRLRRKACEVARAIPNPRAVAPLARALGDPDPEVRSAAAQALGSQSSAEAVAPLLGRLDDPSPSVRVQVVFSLSQLGDARAVFPLVGKVQDSSPEVRTAVARALGDLGDRRASAALALALRDPNDDVRRDALAALGRMRAVDAIDAISPFVADRSVALRSAALFAIGQIASAGAVRLLIGALGTGDDAGASLEPTPVRSALVVAAQASIPQLHALLAASPSAPEAASAAWVLGALGAQSEADNIVAALRRGVLPAAAALHALAGAGTTADVPTALEFLADPSPIVRAEALGAAAALLDRDRPDGRAVEPLVAALRDPRLSTQERARIASLLGQTGARRAATFLVDLAGAADATLRIAAIDALGALGPAGDDDALLGALAQRDPVTRLHAAVALSKSGGARARDALLAGLDGGEELDRSALLTALGGVLTRAPTDAAVAKLKDALDLAAGPERDALIEALGRAPSASAVGVLATIARGPDPADRSQAAAILAAHPRDASALAAARALLADTDPSVRGQAAWALGSIGQPRDLPALGNIARDAETGPAINAVAAMGRIHARAGIAETPAPALCELASDPRPYVRANALAGMALAKVRCADGSLARAALSRDPSEDVRAAAALAVAEGRKAEGGAGDADWRALERCVRVDPSGAVASRCVRPFRPAPGTAPVLVYVMAEAAPTPREGGAYAMLCADGMIHAGVTDRRGAVFDPVAPEGELSLRPPSSMAR